MRLFFVLEEQVILVSFHEQTGFKQSTKTEISTVGPIISSNLSSSESGQTTNFIDNINSVSLDAFRVALIVSRCCVMKLSPTLHHLVRNCILNTPEL